jgi:hypothetical protein
MKGYFAGAAGAAAGAAGAAGAAAGAAFLATFLAFFTVLAGASAAFSAGAAGAAFSWATATPSESANIIAVRIATIFFIQYHLRSFNNGIYRRFFVILSNRKQE